MQVLGDATERWKRARQGMIERLGSFMRHWKISQLLPVVLISSTYCLIEKQTPQAGGEHTKRTTQKKKVPQRFFWSLTLRSAAHCVILTIL